MRRIRKEKQMQLYKLPDMFQQEENRVPAPWTRAPDRKTCGTVTVRDAG